LYYLIFFPFFQLLFWTDAFYFCFLTWISIKSKFNQYPLFTKWKKIISYFYAIPY
jgi:hypothetical protein